MIQRISLFFLLILFAATLPAQKIARDGYQSPTIPEDDIIAEYINCNIFVGHLPNGEEVSELLYQRIPFLKENISQFELTDLTESPGGHHLMFRQTYMNRPVFRGYVKLNMSRDFRIVSVSAIVREFEPIEQGKFAFTPEKLEELLVRKFKNGQELFEVSAEEGYLIRDGRLRPVLIARTFGNVHTGSYELVYDAQTLNEISRRDLSSYCAPPPPPDTTCMAKVYLPDPITSSGSQIYGSNYVDNRDSNSPYLNAWRVSVPLRDMDFDGTTYNLSGPYVRILDFEAPFKAPYSFSDCNIDVLRFDDAFEGVNAYYHIDTFQRYVQGLGFVNLGALPIRVDPHAMNGDDNSRFTGNGSSSALAFGEGGVDDAEDADVVLHEYGHALSYFGSQNTNSGTERRGLDEGIGDYIAASYSKSISTYRWAEIYTWDGHNEFWDGRRADLTTSYNLIDKSDIYEVGQLWASVLMQAEDALGQEIMNTIAFQELYYNAPGITLKQAAQNILKADTAAYGGIHTPTLVFHFCQFDILTGAECAVALTGGQSPYSWDVFPNPASNSVRIRFNQFKQSDLQSIELIDVLGRELWRSEVDGTELQLNTTQFGDGIYFLRLNGASGVIDNRKLIIRK